LAICFGLHAWPTGDPDADRGVGRSTSGPRIEGPSGAVNAPDSRSCTYSRSRSLAASLLTFGRHVCRFSLPLRDDGPIVQRAAAGRRVAAQLPGSPSVRRSRSAALRVRHPSDRPPSVGRVAVPISVLLHILGQQNGVQWEWNGESLLAYREAGVRVGWADNAAPCADQMPCRHDTCRNQEDVTHEAECHPGAGPRPDLPALPPRSRRPQGPSWKRAGSAVNPRRVWSATWGSASAASSPRTPAPRRCTSPGIYVQRVQDAALQSDLIAYLDARARDRRRPDLLPGA
jgi:hypothetical protein